SVRSYSSPRSDLCLLKPDFFTGRQNWITFPRFCGGTHAALLLHPLGVLRARTPVRPALGCVVLDDQRQCLGVDVKQVAVDVYLLRCSLPFAEKTCVALER